MHPTDQTSTAGPYYDAWAERGAGAKRGGVTSARAPRKEKDPSHDGARARARADADADAPSAQRGSIPAVGTTALRRAS